MDDLVSEVANIVVDGFEGISWTDIPSAITDVRESFGVDRVSRVAIDSDGHAISWIGGIKKYDGHVWEMHPLVVRPEMQRLGIGAALVDDFEQCVLDRGGETIMLGADDETNSISLGGVDLYPDMAEHIRNIRNLAGHQFEFYQKQGYRIVGVIPDANWAASRWASVRVCARRSCSRAAVVCSRALCSPARAFSRPASVVCAACSAFKSRSNCYRASFTTRSASRPRARHSARSQPR